MSCTYIADKVVKVRKRHQCRVCGEWIEKGDSCRLYRGVETGEGFYTIYFHHQCWEHSRDWDMDWESISPGEISREEIARDACG